jgi:DNA-binding Lrp family transcriptional regulator
MDEILEVLEKDGRASAEDIAKMLKKKPQQVRDAIKRYEKEGVILKYKAVITQELVREPARAVRALIEVNVTRRKT